MKFGRQLPITLTGHISLFAIVMKSSDKSVIGIVSWDFLQPKGGMGRSMQWIAETMRSDCHVEVFPLLSFTHHFGGHLLFSLCLPFVLRCWIRSNHISALIIPGGPGGVFLLRHPGVPFICSVYHIYEQQARLVPGQWWKKLFIPFEKRTYRSAATVLTFNEDSRAILHKVYGVSVEKMPLLSHAIDTVQWKGTGVSHVQKGLCVCVARLEARKGVEVLLRAWKSVAAEFPHAHLVIVGHGVLSSTVDRRLSELGSSAERVDALTSSALIALVRRAEIVVCPSFLEGFGLSAAESMAAGTAVIASDAEGLRCLLREGQTGFLFKPGDADSLAARMIEVLKNDDTRIAVATAAQQEAMERFDFDRTSRALRDAVAAVLFTNHG
jgi:glycosyltransferase involved in cell wall biosynthesis